jgi:D-glycero-D-manno-heptose 1,7-bisphosphate phosphatase
MALSGLDMKLIIPDHDTLLRIHGKWRDVVTVAASEITAVVYCSHGSDHDCACRKPQPGLLQDFTPSPGCA